jgi:ATP-dependent DNA helicase DinG
LDPDKLKTALTGYHPRSTQIKAAELIDNAFRNYQDIVIEAPTGSGKTMAYLIPAFDQGKRAIISTKTKQLMQQLYLKDMPVMRAVFGDCSVAVIKGKKNYFCPHRFMRWIYPNSVYYQDVIEWYQSVEGDVKELPTAFFDAGILDKMSADSHQCIYAKCQFFQKCPFYAAKDAANAAQVVITNHYLLLTDVAVMAADGQGTTIDPAEHIIFDEAHSIADIYAMFAGAEISLRRLTNTLADYKEKLPFEKLRQLPEIQEAIRDITGDGKAEYEKVREKAAVFIDICRELVEMAKESDLKNEFGRWETSFATLNGDKEGLRFAEQRGRDVLLKYVPLEPDGSFIDGLGKISLSSLFISATLSSNGSFDYFLRETGLDGDKLTIASLPNVFEIHRQAKLFVPDMRKKNRDAVMLELIKGVRGSVLIICNSLKRMTELIDFISSVQSEKTVFSQKDGDWSTFVSNENIVLIGCASLREGIDLAGGDFRCVIIDKLPFEYPHDLYLSMKSRRIEEETGNAFANYNLPRAALYFKQAVGRLIRHESDRGICAVFDDRILTKSYGKIFLNVLDSITITDSVQEALYFLNIEQ